MDERELANHIVELIDHAAHRNHVQRVTAVRLAVGGRRAVDLWQLNRTFKRATKGTVAQGARLAVEILPIGHHCRNCGADFKSVKLEPACPKCHHPHTEATGGEELRLLDIEADEGGPAESAHPKTKHPSSQK